MNTPITLVSGVVISPDNDAPEAVATLARAIRDGFQGKSIGPHPLLHLWQEQGTTHRANGERYDFGFRALLSGSLAALDQTDDDNVTLLEDVAVEMADKIIFYMLRDSAEHKIILVPHQSEQRDG